MPLTTGEIGDMLGVQLWRVQRLFEDGDVPEVPRAGGRRIIDESMIPAIQAALEKRGWLPRQRRKVREVLA